LEATAPNKQDAKMYKLAAPLGHYHSPIPEQDEVLANEHIIWGPAPRTLPGIDLNEEGQLALLREFKQYYNALPFEENPKNGLRYYLNNLWFGHGDAIALYGMMRHFKPKRIIEIGSGFSSAVILDTNDLFLDGSVSGTFIEPHPERLLSLFTERDRQQQTLLAAPVQDVDLGLFQELGANDILFVDSSHVSKVHSDVNWILFEILPRLADNVLIQFHDVFYPFEYPKEWVTLGVAWNEDYLLRAFLQYNHAFRIEWFNAFLGCFHQDLLQSEMPLCHKNPGGSIWLKKMSG
jgi:Methyltransferase domain